MIYGPFIEPRFRTTFHCTHKDRLTDCCLSSCQRYCSYIGYTLKVYKESSCLIYLICFCLRMVVFNTYCVVLLFCLSPWPFSLDCPSILITPSVFSNVYLYSILSSVQNSDASVFLYFTF